MDNNVNQGQNMNKKEHDFRNVTLAIVGMFVLLAAVSGGTYAYYAFNAANTTVVNGTAATASLNLSVTKVSTDASGQLVPQLDTYLPAALIGTSNKPCVDGLGNTVCQIYQIKVDNPATAGIYIRGFVSFQIANSATSTFANLKWALLAQQGSTFTKYTSSNPATFGNLASSGTQIATGTQVNNAAVFLANPANEDGTHNHGTKFCESISMNAGSSKYFYIVVWISETNTDQSNTDKGTFTGTIFIEDSNGQGLTSTFRGAS